MPAKRSSEKKKKEPQDSSKKKTSVDKGRKRPWVTPGKAEGSRRTARENQKTS